MSRPGIFEPALRVAVYGSLKTGHYNHAYLKKAHFIGTFHTAPEYTMIDLGAYPAIIADGKTQIEVEIYEVDPDTLTALDELEEHPDCFMRTLIRIEDMEVFIYVLNPEQVRGMHHLSHRIIESGRW